MNYMTGLALGMSAGQTLYGLWHKEKKEQPPAGFILTHAVPGRCRYRNVLLQQDNEFAAFIRYHLPLLRRITSCEVNDLSGSIVICFAPGEEAYVDAGLRLLESLYQSKTPYGKLGMNIRHVAGRLNRFVRVETGQMLDIKTVVACFMLFEGLRKCLIQGQAFAGPNLLWWSYSLMKGSGK